MTDQGSLTSLFGDPTRRLARPTETLAPTPMVSPRNVVGAVVGSRTVELATRASQTGAMTVTDDNPVAVLRIELEDIKPLIWRRFAVPTSMNLKAVHSVIQAVLGWLDCHLWEFEASGRKYSLRIPNDPDWNARITNAATIKLSALVTRGRNGNSVRLRHG